MRFFLYLLVALSLASCASVSMPTGGPRDDQPPRIVESIPDSAQLSFFSRKIVLRFDENVKLNNLKNELIVSPPIGEYEVKNSEDKIELTFDEYPEVNTTYTLNFGNAIQDVNEGNILSNLMLVFSTGNEIDTGTISGLALDQYTEEPVKESLVLLYQNTTDSNFLYGSPYYMTKTDDEGHFHFYHLAEGYYDLILIADENGNRKLDSEESFAFYTDSVLINTDSLILKTSQYQDDIVLNGRIIPSKTAHQYVIPFNKTVKATKIEEFDVHPAMDFTVRKLSPPTQLNKTNDSLYFYYKPNVPTDSFQVVLIHENDTLKLESPINASQRILPIHSSNRNIQINPSDSITLFFNQPLKSVRKEGVRVMNVTDSFYIKDFQLTHKDYTLKIFHDWKSSKKYEVVFDSAAILGIDTINNKKITVNISTRNSENLSSFSFTPILDSSFSDTTPVYAVLYTKSSEFTPRKIESGTPIHYKYINPGKYRIKFYTDLNGDEEWTPSKVFPRQVGEPIFFHPASYELKANWIAEDNIIKVLK